MSFAMLLIQKFWSTIVKTLFYSLVLVQVVMYVLIVFW